MSVDFPFLVHSTKLEVKESSELEMEKTFGVSWFIPPPSPTPYSKSSLHSIFSLPSCTVFTVFTQLWPLPLENDVGGSVQFFRGEERYCLCPQLTFMNLFVGGLS